MINEFIMPTSLISCLYARAEPREGVNYLCVHAYVMHAYNLTAVGRYWE